MQDRTDPTTGFLRGQALGSRDEHLYAPGAHFTLCGRTVLYRLQHTGLRKKCRRCQWEAGQRAAETTAP